MNAAQIEAAARVIDPAAWDHHDRMAVLIAEGHTMGLDFSDALAPADVTARSLRTAEAALAAAERAGERPS